MPAWLSPFPVEPQREQELRHSGWTRWEGELAEFPADGALLYDTPDRLLLSAGEALLGGYQQLLELSGSVRCVAIWRLLQVGAASPPPEPLAGALSLAVITADSAVLEAYLDLELKADLLGGEPDVGYRSRLKSSLDPAAMLLAWQSLKPLEEFDALAERLDAAQSELSEAHEQVGELEGVKEQLAARESELKEAREEAELTLLQLHQVQEELEHYFLLGRGQQQQLERYSALQQRSQRLLAQVLIGRS